MFIRFWGTRGSVPAPGLGTVRYGGNTSCVEIRSGTSIAIMDCGTGARALGGALMAHGGPLRLNLLLTHFHWDHIQGFPFFLPIFLPGTELDIFGAAGFERGLEEAMSSQMQYTYFPVRLADLVSRINFHEVGESTFLAGEIAVESQFLNHTCPTLGYRLSSRGRSVAYITDHEPFWPHNPDLPLREALVHPGDLRHVQFLRDVDLLIHDAQYTSEEYPAKRGWGHSPVEYVVDVAISAGVKQLALFHHDPPRTDERVEAVLERAREHVHLRGATLDVIAAAEGLTLELEEREAERPIAVSVPSNPPPVLSRLLIVGDVDKRRPLRAALVEDGYRISEATLDQWLESPRALRADVVIVALEAGAAATAAVARVRRQIGRRPLMAVLHGNVDQALLRSMHGIVDDVVVEPFGMPNLRARVRAHVPAPALARRLRDGSSAEPPLASLESALDLEVERARRLGYSIGVVLGDVDGSPKRGGAPARSLAAIAQNLRTTLRRTDVVGTTADGHVGVILPGLSPEGLPSVRLRVGSAIGGAFDGSRRGQVRLAGHVVASNEADAAALLAQARHQLASR